MEGMLRRRGSILQGHEREPRSNFHCLINDQSRKHRIAIATDLQEKADLFAAVPCEQ